MLNDFIEKVRDFILKPVETFQKCKEDSLGNALTYYLYIVKLENEIIHVTLKDLYIIIYNIILMCTKNHTRTGEKVR